ncbi:hypothetical protein KSC_107370 [Ktedonobacter sp. SOSP1-52]|nr:hypothetical protein KSC_107370 [Ktedonobacter sp. SOSP1-52]
MCLFSKTDLLPSNENKFPPPKGGLTNVMASIQKAHVEDTNRAYTFAFELGIARNTATIAYNEPFTPSY